MKKYPYFLLFLLPTCLLLAQREPSRSIQFSLLAWKDTITDLYFNTTGSDTPVVIPNGAPTEYYFYSGPEPIVFFSLGKDGEGNVLKMPRAIVPTLSKDVSCWLFLVLENPAGSDLDYRIVAIPDDVNGAKANSFLFYNLMSTDLAVRVDSSKLLVPSGQYKVIELTEKGGENVLVQVVAAQSPSNWKLIYQSRWGHPKERKIWAFLVEGDDGKPKIRKYYQRKLP